VTFILILFLLLAGVPSHGFTVWFAGDGFRVDAVTGKAFEAGPIYPDPLSGDYKKVNAVWNGKRVSLQAGRNEAASFQIIVEREKEPAVKGLVIEISDLTGKNGNILTRSKYIALFRQWYLQVKEPSIQKTFKYFHSFGNGWYPDPLVPLDNPAVDKNFLFPVDIPSEVNKIGNEQRVQGFWVDLFVPENTSVGEYTATVTIKAQGIASKKIPIEFTVLNYTIPSVNHVMVGGMTYGGRWLSRMGPYYPQRLFSIAKQHRIQFEPTGMAPPWVNGELIWSPVNDSAFNFDKVMGPVLDGSLFTEKYGYFGPNQGVPFEQFLLPFHVPTQKDSVLGDCYPPAPFYLPSKGKPPLENRAFVQAFQKILRDFEKHFREKGWTQTQAILFVNNFLDEPRGRDLWISPDGDRHGGYSFIRWMGETINQAGLKDRKWVLFRNDLGDVKSVGEWIPGWNLDSIFSMIGPITDIFNICASPKYFPVKYMADYVNKHKKQAMFYFSCTSGEPAFPPAMLDMETNGYALWSWISWRYGLRGGLHWDIMVWGGRDGATGWEKAFSGWHGDGWMEQEGGDCFGYYNIQGLIYNGRYIGIPDEPIHSIRLKSMRRGEQDYEYLWLLAQKDGNSVRADSIVRSVVPRALDDGWEDFNAAMGKQGAWLHDPAQIDIIRKRLQTMLP